jgi:hypothetical protein
MILYENRNRLIVFDDADSVFKDDVSRNLLKAALDSYAKRTISWKSKLTFDPSGMTDSQVEEIVKSDNIYPSEFDFTGRIIFISNIPSSKMEPAILSRSFVIDITLKAQDVITRIKSILPNVLPDVDISTKKEVLNHLIDSTDELEGGQVNMRTFINSTKIRLSGSKNWKRLIKRYA